MMGENDLEIWPAGRRTKSEFVPFQTMPSVRRAKGIKFNSRGNSNAPREVPTGFIRKVAKRILAEAGFPDEEVGVFLLSGKEMRDLKLRTTGERKKMVDVLSFAEPSDFPHPEISKKTVGEVYLNFEHFCNDKRRLVVLLIHGILHLLNFRHASIRDTIRMRRAEKKIFRALGLF